MTSRWRTWLTPATLAVAAIAFAAGSASVAAIALPIHATTAPQAHAGAHAPFDGVARENDSVTFEVDVYDRAGTLQFTSNGTRGAAAAAAGGVNFAPDATNGIYRARYGRINFSEQATPTDTGTFRIPLSPSRLLVGHSAGDVVETPLLVAPFGEAPRRTIPAVFEHVTPAFTLDLARLYSAQNTTNSTAKFGPRDAFAPGYHIKLVDVLDARVDRVDGDTAHLTMLFTEDRTVHSEVFGLDMRVHPEGDGTATLTPIAAPGQVFETYNCVLPIADLANGRYRVVSADDTGIVVQFAPQLREHLYGLDLRFVFTIIEVRPASIFDAHGGFLDPNDKWK